MADQITDSMQGKELPKSAAAHGENHDALINRLAQEHLMGAPGRNTLVSQDLASDNTMVRYGQVTLDGLGKVPEGIGKSVLHNLTNPLEMLETAGTAAGMAFVLKTVLPEGGMAGKVAGALIGGYFTYKAAEPVFGAYKLAGNAVTVRDMNVAATQIGDAGGSFLVNSLIAAGAYKLGSHYTDRMLTSEALDGFADKKANFYAKLGDSSSKLTSSITDRLGITTPKPPEAPITPQVAGSLSLDPRVKFLASERSTPQGLLKGEIDPNAPMEVSVMLKSKGSELAMNRTLARIAQGRQAALSDADLLQKFGATQESLDALTRFANENGLKVAESNLTSGRVVLSGSTGQFSEAFQTKLAQYEHPSGAIFRGREGSLSVPQDLSQHIVGILGMDNRPQARSYHIKFAGPVPELPAEPPTGGPPSRPLDPPVGGQEPHSTRAFMPNEVADAYNFPKDSMGKGQAVGIVELGGGIDMADNAKYYKQHGLPLPKINVIEVGGAKNSPGGAADGEVLLDSQVIGVIAPEATQNLLFAPNSEKGFTDSITRLTFPEKGEVQNSAISISWGQNEEAWTQQAISGMSQAFKKAALKGISIFAASGDDGALDNSRSGKLQADYPASDPMVTGTGGTRLEVGPNGKITNETVWNNHRPNDAGGGGISQVFPPQDFQKDIKTIPLNANTGKPGRGVPDIAGNADPVTGYRIRVGGSESQTGGTSAVSPLYSALMMRINGALDKPFATPLNQWLYKNAESGIFNDITIGDNNGYKAGPGWDATTGLGSIDGSKMLALIRSNPHLDTNFGNFRYLGPTQFGGSGQQNQ